MWLTDRGQKLPATVSTVSVSEVSFVSEYGKVSGNGYQCPLIIIYILLSQKVSHPRDSLTHDKAAPMHDTSIASVDDMAELGDLHEGAILYNIYQRYTDLIYVS